MGGGDGGEAPWIRPAGPQDPGAEVGFGVVENHSFKPPFPTLWNIVLNLPEGCEAGTRRGVVGEALPCPVPLRVAQDGHRGRWKKSMVEGPNQEGLCPAHGPAQYVSCQSPDASRGSSSSPDPSTWVTLGKCPSVSGSLSAFLCIRKVSVYLLHGR